MKQCFPPSEVMEIRSQGSRATVLKQHTSSITNATLTLRELQPPPLSKKPLFTASGDITENHNWSWRDHGEPNPQKTSTS